MRKIFLTAAATILMMPMICQAAFVDFNGIGVVGDLPLPIVADGVSVSFLNLEISEVGASSNGFWGDGYNDVYPTDQAHLNGQFLTAQGYGNAQYRASEFTRTIIFDQDVTNVSFYIADIDAGEGVMVTAFDNSDAILSATIYPASLNLHGRVLNVNLGNLSGIRKLTLVGNDPIGIDNLSFDREIIRVAIDIKPSNDTNTINMNSSGVIPVAILSSSEFEAVTVDPSTISLAGANVKIAGKSENELCQYRDVNLDGMIDLECKVLTAQFLVEVGETSATLIAETFDGQKIQGEDFIRIVPDN